MTQRARDWSLLPLRLFLGVTFTFAGLQKLANPSYLHASSPTSVQATMLSLRHTSPIGWLLGLSAHAPVLVGVLIALGELAVGLATLVGLWVRVTAAGGLLLSLTFFLTVSFHTRPYYYGSDIVFLFAWTVPLLAGAWPEPTLDAWIRRQSARDSDPQRRALVLGGAGALVLAGITSVLAAFDAAVGRALHGSTSAHAADNAQVAAAPTPTPTPTSAAPSDPPSTSSSPRATPPGRHVANVSDVPQGEAMRFTAPDGSPAWLLHEPDGSFRAFSAVCTHAGCTVGLSGGQFVCPCHGGRYSTADGAVVAGPPPAPLGRVDVKVFGTDIRVV